MDRQSVESSAIRSIGYEPHSDTLEVEFRSGRVYWYYDVPERIHRQFMAAESKGRFFNLEIKPVYRYGRV